MNTHIGFGIRASHVAAQTLVWVIATGSGLAQTFAEAPAAEGTSTDLFVMFGSDVVRSSDASKTNSNIGLGQTFGFLKKDPIGATTTAPSGFKNCSTRS